MPRPRTASYWGRTCDNQWRFPHYFELHSLSNRSWADYCQRQCENGGHVPLLAGEEQGLRLRGWAQNRIERLTAIIQLIVEGTQPIKTRFIDHHLAELGFEPCDFRRGVVGRALHSAYRDACLYAEDALQAAIAPPAAAPPPPSAVPSVAADIVVSDEPHPETAAKPRMSEIMQQAVNGLVADEAWGAKSGRQLFGTVKLFELLIGPKPFASITQAELAAFKSKLRFVPKHYSISEASRKAVLEAVAACEAKEAAAGGKADRKTHTLSNRTLSVTFPPWPPCTPGLARTDILSRY